MLATFRRPSVAAAVCCLTACYSYAPSVTPPAPGARVSAELTDAGTVELARYLGPGAGTIEGRVLTVDDSVLNLAVSAVRKRNGAESEWSGEPVPLRRALVAHLGVRELSRGRTAAAAGAFALAVGGVALTFASGGTGGGSGGTGGGGKR